MITAIIPHYFKEREDNLQRIMDSYKTSSVSEVIIWDNTGELKLKGDNIVVVNSPKNVGCKGRFLAAMMADNDVILFQDNDVCVEDGTIEYMKSKLHDNIVTLDGRILCDDGAYFAKDYLQNDSNHIVRPPKQTDVVISLARVEMMKKSTFLQIFITSYFDEMEMDDIWLSWIAHTLSVGIIVPEHKDGCGFINLDERNAGASHVPTHYDKRDELCKRLFK